MGPGNGEALVGAMVLVFVSPPLILLPSDVSQTRKVGPHPSRAHMELCRRWCVLRGPGSHAASC
jgi:hypothetical protein